MSSPVTSNPVKPNSESRNSETICAIATPRGIGGVGIVRISGSKVRQIMASMLDAVPEPRYAQFSAFHDDNQELIDKGIALFFPAPNSFTGEDVLEIQAHGGPVILDRLMQSILALGARNARPGEFSERAFLNNKIDLAQAEAIADLIESRSIEASRYAMRSLQGEFSNLIHQLVAAITKLRVFVEASIDFPEEEIDFLQSGEVLEQLISIKARLEEVLKQAKTGAIIKEGLAVVIAGEPNVGKSSLLNLLSGQSSAIVTDIAGTTRDSLRELITIDGLPLHIIDTAGLRESTDIVEQEGIKRTWQEINKADHILFVSDAGKALKLADNPSWRQLQDEISNPDKITLIDNKIDLLNLSPGLDTNDPTGHCRISMSALNKEGLNLLIDHLKTIAGFSSTEEGGFIARRRHLDALNRANQALQTAYEQLTRNKAGELLAEDLRAAQEALSEITGEFTADDLLGEIFSSFCIGK